jgi:Tfp pilus assembly protein FimV
MLLSKRSQFMLVLLVALHGWAGANESSKQPPLELPKALADGEPVAMVEKAKPDPVKKATPKSEAVTSREVKAVTLPPAKPAAATPVAAARDLSGLPEMTNYTTRKGDTVEKILQKFYPASPLRADVLRDSLVQNNPKAFPKGNAKSLVIGSNVSLPDPLELSKRLLLPVVSAVNKSDKPDTPSAVPPAAVAVAPVAPTPANPGTGGGAAAHSAGHNMAMQDPPKRHWVRYP